MAGWQKVLLFGVAAFISVGVLLTIVGIGALRWASSVAEELGTPTSAPTAVSIAVAQSGSRPGRRVLRRDAAGGDRAAGWQIRDSVWAGRH